MRKRGVLWLQTCVFLCAGGESGGGGGGGGEEGVWEVAAPDADPLKEEQRGEAAEKRLKSRPKRRKSVQTSPRAARTRRAGCCPAIHAENSHLCFSESAFILRPCAEEEPPSSESAQLTEPILIDQGSVPNRTRRSDRTVLQVIDFKDAAVIDVNDHIHSQLAEGYQSDIQSLV